MEFIATITTQVTRERVGDLICNAWEGWSYYWIDGAEVTRTGFIPKGGAPDSLGFCDAPCPYPWQHPLYGGEVRVDYGAEEGEDKHAVFSGESVRRGWELFQRPEYRQHLNNFIEENDDAITGDVFLQLCVLGEVVYG